MTELDPKNLKAFGKNLRELRKARDLTQEGLAEMLTNQIKNLSEKESSVEAGRISRWETSKPYKGRYWYPNSEQVLGLIRIFVEELTLKDAKAWAKLLNYEFSNEIWERIFDEEKTKPEDGYIKRKQFEELIKTALTDRKVSVLVLHGMGGAGKTMLAEWAAKNLESYFKNGVVFIRSTNKITITKLLGRIASKVGCKLTSAKSRDFFGNR